MNINTNYIKFFIRLIAKFCCLPRRLPKLQAGWTRSPPGLIPFQMKKENKTQKPGKTSGAPEIT
jgi:hypothetical protein